MNLLQNQVAEADFTLERLVHVSEGAGAGARGSYAKPELSSQEAIQDETVTVGTCSKLDPVFSF